MDLEKLLEFIKKTNPDMTIEKLVAQLKVSEYSTKALIITAKSASI